MQLVRTTVRLRPDIKKAAERKAVEEDTTFGYIVHRALEDYLAKAATHKARRLVFHTHDLGVPLDNLTRDDYYPDPAVHAR
ncbi:hypothetical protein HY411_02090 [Candidatus Gottesmanbacteria bacterium]|nr:hypothetical protein [Candidatus Gottesmanbacteria bacterium]